MLKIILSVLALLIGSSTQASSTSFASIKQDCKTGQDPILHRVCITTTKGSNSQDILYYFHGLGNDEEAWVTHGAYKKVRSAWYGMDKDMPTVISISFGKAWILAEKNKSSQSGLFEVVMDSIFPQLEANLPFTIRNRYGIGHSMGGLNITQIIMKRPDFFQAAAAICPGITKISPYSSPIEVQAYIKRTGAKQHKVLYALQVGRAFHADDEDWNETNPLLLAETMLGPQTPRLYVSVADRDDYGFQEGAELWAQKAQDSGVDTEWHYRKGGHCVVKGSQVAKFFVKTIGN